MAKKVKIVEVAPFGELTHVVADLWQRPIKLTFLGRAVTVPVSVNLDEKKPVAEPEQVKAFEAYTAAPGKFIAAAENALQKAFKAQLAGKGKIALESVSFPYARPCPTFGFLCTCNWEEDGLAVKFEDGKLAEVGTQDILL